MDLTGLYNPYVFLSLVVIKTSIVGLFLSCFARIKDISAVAVSIVTSPFFMCTVMLNSGCLTHFRNPQFKSFTTILLLFTALTPIFRTLFADIDDDTIFFSFTICQFVFCTDSIGTSLKKIHKEEENQHLQARRIFRREETITLEEGLILPMRTEDNCVVGSMAFLFGCFCLFSRLKSNLEVLVLQGIGFFLYMFLPFLIERQKIHLRLRDSGLITSLLLLGIYSADRRVFRTVLYLLSGEIAIMTATIEILKRINAKF